MAEIRRDSFTEGVKADMYAYSVEKYPQVPPVFSQIFELADSNRAYELSTTAIGPEDLIRKPEGEPITFSRAGEGFTVSAKMETFSRGLEFTFEQVQDMNPMKIADTVVVMASEWTDSYLRNIEEEAASMFNYGGYTAGHSIFNATVAGYTDPTGDLAYDGKPFFNASGNLRPLYPGATGTHYNGVVSSPISEANLQTLYDLMTVTNSVNSRGKKTVVQPDVLLYPPGLRWTVKKLLETEKQIDSGNNTINTVYNLLRPVEWRYLTDTDAWFLGASKRGLKFYNRMPLTFDFYRDNETLGYKATAVARFGFEMNNFRYWVGANYSES